MEHLHQLIKWVDYRGADLPLDLQGPALGPQQFIPYPAFLWVWEVVQHMAWRQPQHINILEYNAFFQYVRSLSNDLCVNGHRMFHVFDSKVVSSAVAKGRSPSRRMNRLARRTLPYLLAKDLYVYSVWTISRWMYADGASRLHV